jgi:hypothetical protein
MQNLMTVKKRSGLSSEKRVSRAPAEKASEKTAGAAEQFFDRILVASNTSLRILTGSVTREGRWLYATSLIDQDREITREELHQLFWSKPTSTVTKDSVYMVTSRSDCRQIVKWADV